MNYTKPEALTKNGKYNNATAPDAEYEIVINPAALDLDPNSDVLYLEDVMSSSYELVAGSINVSPAADDFAFDASSNKMTFTLKDSTSYKITYSARMTLPLGTDLDSSNSGNDAKLYSKNKVLMGKVKFVENKNQYDVFAPEQDMKVPVGVSAYSVNKIVGEKIMLGDVETISKGKAVLLYSEEIQTKELYTAAIPEPTKTRADVGDEEKEKERICELKVVTKDPNKKKDEDQGLDVKLGQVYMLYNDVFYPTQAGRIPVGGIYLEIKEDKKDEVLMTRSFLTIGGVADDADDAITAIDNSPLSIVHCPLSTSWYDLRGRKLNGAPTTKGVYINNGKKLIIR